MELKQVEYGQRIRVNMPGVGDHGQLGTIKKVQHERCYVHLDWDQHRQRLVMFYPKDLETIPQELAPAS